MADDTKSTAPAAPKPEKVPAGIPVQTGTAAPAPTKTAAADTKAAVEKAGFVLVKKNPHVVSVDVFETGDFKIGREPVAIPAGELDAVTAHRDEYGRQYVVKA